MLSISSVLYAAGGKKPIKIAYFTDDAPWMFTNSEGQADGLVHDLWKLWAVKNNVAIQFVASSSGKIGEQLIRSEVDALAYTPPGIRKAVLCSRNQATFVLNG